MSRNEPIAGCQTVWPYHVFILATASAWFGGLAPSFFPTSEQVRVSIGGLEVNRDAAYLTPWALAFCLGGGLGIGVLRVRGILRPTAFAALVCGGVGFVVGAKLQYLLEEFPLWTALRFLPDFFLEPGMRMPLGLLIAGLVACGSAAAWGVPWRALGDAWAVASSAVITVGRIGCLLVGCCAGTVCGPSVPAFLCWSYPPDSEVFADQVALGLIAATRPTSLPIHPLPLYFSLASLLTNVALLTLLRRGAAPGALLAAFCLLRPLVKLGLEPLRADPRPGLLMTAIPAAVLTATCVILLVVWIGRARTPDASSDVVRRSHAARPTPPMPRA